MSVRRSLNSLANKDIVSIEDQVKCSTFYNDPVIFDYKLNDKAGKSKLLKGAKRNVFVVEENSTSTTLIFSAGAWHAVILPSQRYWEQVKGDQTCKVGDVGIKVGGIKSGKDTSGKQVVQKVVFLADRNKIVCHFYNTTQKVLVNGHGYKPFIEIFLKPFFQQKIDVSTEEIAKVNTLLMEKLGPKTVKRSSVKFKGKMSFPCNQCDYVCKSVITLNNHRISQHTVSFNESKKLLEPWHSTRNSSISSYLMVEDITNDIVEENVLNPNMDEASSPILDHSQTNSTNSIRCDWDPCDFKSKQKSVLIKHIDKHIGQKNFHQEQEVILIDDSTEEKDEPNLKEEEYEYSNVEKKEIKEKATTPKDEESQENEESQSTQENRSNIETVVEPLYSCDKCDFDSDKLKDVEEHKAIDVHNVHYQNVTIDENEDNSTDRIPTYQKCDFCEYKAIDNYSMATHGKQKHGTFKCERCNYSAIDNEVMENHMTYHTGRIVFTCGVCEFEATRKALLQIHMENKHMKKESHQNQNPQKCKTC